MREELFSRLYDHYYREAMAAGRGDIDASLWAYDTASSDLIRLNHAELRAYMREIGC